MRLFGTRLANRDQFNLIYFDQTEKDTNSELNTFDDRRKQHAIANYYRQDFIWPGYTAQMQLPSTTTTGPDFQFDKNGFLVRPDPAGVFQPHQVDSYYIGWTGDGHINRFNITHAFYWVLGRDTLNPIAGQAQDINAQMRRHRILLRPRLGPLPHVVLLGSPATTTRTTTRPRASTRSSTTPTSRAASSATGSGSRSGCSACNS